MSEAGQAAEAKPKSALSLDLILVLVNLLALGGAAGFMAYTKLVFKRPPITEEAERAKIEARKAAAPPASPAVLLPFEAQTVNISAQPTAPKAANGTPEQLQGKLHYANIAFSIEVRDGNYKDYVESMKPKILDAFNSHVNRKSFADLNNVQGRYVLRSELVEMINTLLASERGAPPAAKDGLISNLYFSTFLVQ